MDSRCSIVAMYWRTCKLSCRTSPATIIIIITSRSFSNICSSSYTSIDTRVDRTTSSAIHSSSCRRTLRRWQHRRATSDRRRFSLRPSITNEAPSRSGTLRPQKHQQNSVLEVDRWVLVSLVVTRLMRWRVFHRDRQQIASHATASTAVVAATPTRRGRTTNITTTTPTTTTATQHARRTSTKRLPAAVTQLQR